MQLRPTFRLASFPLAVATAFFAFAVAVPAAPADANVRAKVKVGHFGVKKSVGVHRNFGHVNRFHRSRFGVSRFHDPRFSRFDTRFHRGSRFHRSGVVFHDPFAHRGFSSSRTVIVNRPVVRDRVVVVRDEPRDLRVDGRVQPLPPTRVDRVPARGVDPYAARINVPRSDDPSVEAELGLDALERGNWLLAQQSFGRAAMSDPGRAAHKVGFGVAAALRGEYETAEFAFDRARRIAGTRAFEGFPLQGEARGAVRTALAEDASIPGGVRETLMLLAGQADADRGEGYEARNG